MVHIEVTDEEFDMLVAMLDIAVASARRSRGKANLSQLKAVYEHHEVELLKLKGRLLDGKGKVGPAGPRAGK